VARAGYSTVFPQAIGMAATWDPSIVQAMGNVISTEARAKYNQAQRQGNHRIFYGLTFWSPNINIVRDPRWGRGQETYGEDPFLTSRLGRGLCHRRAGRRPEPPARRCHQQALCRAQRPETLRHGFNVDPSPRDLEETYLPAFRATVTEGHVQSVMCAYNSIDGWPACTNKMLLKEHLRDAWGFKGFVVSDCGAIVDVNQGHKKTADIMHSAALAFRPAPTSRAASGPPASTHWPMRSARDWSRRTWSPRRPNGSIPARFQLGLFDPQGSSPLDKIRFLRRPPVPIAKLPSRPPKRASFC
jgi:beta-glucosidase